MFYFHGFCWLYLFVSFLVVSYFSLIILLHQTRQIRQIRRIHQIPQTPRIRQTRLILQTLHFLLNSVLMLLCQPPQKHLRLKKKVPLSKQEILLRRPEYHGSHVGFTTYIIHIRQ